MNYNIVVLIALAGIVACSDSLSPREELDEARERWQARASSGGRTIVPSFVAQ
jgi:hypothetical protein